MSSRASGLSGPSMLRDTDVTESVIIKFVSLHQKFPGVPSKIKINDYETLRIQSNYQICKIPFELE